MGNLKKKRGITLIALIITIVVLVILAGVVIATLNGNGGITGNANKVAGKYNSRASEEKDILVTFENKLKEYAGENTDNSSTPAKPTPTNAEYFSWTTTETEATITGFSDLGKEKYNAGEITKLVIPSEYNGLKVTAIGREAFRSCSKLIEVYIGKEIKTGTDAFAYSDNIKKVTFEEGMTKIPFGIMRRCGGLTEINIPNSVTTIGESAFYNCTNLTTVNFRGTEAQWNAISIGSSNDPLTSATKQFNQ